MRSSCRLVTNEGQPCRKIAVLGTNFCWWHQLAAVNWMTTFIPLIIGCILSIPISEVYYQRSNNLQSHIGNVQLKRDFPRIKGFPATFSIGRNSLTSYRPGYLTISNSPFRLYITEDLKIFLEGELKDQSGARILSIKESEPTPSSKANESYDINHDENSYEIVDKLNRPVFQLYYASKFRSFFVNFISSQFRPDGSLWTVVCSDRLGCREFKGVPQEEHYSPSDRIFEYPGDKFPGVRVKRGETETDPNRIFTRVPGKNE